MKTFSYIVKEPVGLHVRPANMLAKKCKNYRERITISSQGKKAEASRIMQVMSLGVKQGMEILVEVEGEQEERVAEEMKSFFMENL